MKQRILYITISLVCCSNLLAQKVSNADCYEKNKKIYITYSLDKEADISLMVSINGGSFKGINTSFLSGDIGMNVKAGAKKIIIWDVISDTGTLVGNVKFQVIASESFNSYKKKIRNQKYQSHTKRHISSYSYTCNNFYSEAGNADIALFEIGVGVSLKSNVGFPITGSAMTFRYKMIEIALASFTYDLRYVADNPRNGLYWKPQVRAVLPIKENMAFVPSIGPSLDIFNHNWWFVTTIHFRYLYAMSEGSYLDFYAGYEDSGFVLGLSISYAFPINR